MSKNQCVYIYIYIYIYVFSTPAVAISAQPVILESGICYVDLSNYTNEFCKPVQKIEYAIWILQMLESVMWILQCHNVFFYEFQ